MKQSKYSNLFANANRPSHSGPLTCVEIFDVVWSRWATSHIAHGEFLQHASHLWFDSWSLIDMVKWSIHWVFVILKVAVFVMSNFLIRLPSTKAHFRQCFTNLSNSMPIWHGSMPTCHSHVQNGAEKFGDSNAAPSHSAAYRERSTANIANTCPSWFR